MIQKTSSRGIVFKSRAGERELLPLGLQVGCRQEILHQRREDMGHSDSKRWIFSDSLFKQPFILFHLHL